MAFQKKTQLKTAYLMIFTFKKIHCLHTFIHYLLTFMYFVDKFSLILDNRYWNKKIKPK